MQGVAIFIHMNDKITDIDFLSKEASEFTSRSEFARKNRAAYKICLSLDIMDLVCSHMSKFNVSNGKHGNRTMSNEDIALMAAPFKQKSHFKHAFPSAYKAARHRGILEEICKHMEPMGNRFMRKIYVFEHSDNTAYIGLSYNPEKRKMDHLSKNPVLIDKYKTTIQTFKILTEWLPAKEASVIEKHYIGLYSSLGWTILNKATGGALGSNYLKWTKEECSKISVKCCKRSEFALTNPSAYASARVNGWLEELCAHMSSSGVEPWTETELSSIAFSCQTRSGFKLKNAGAYKAARKLGILNKICAHMPKDCRNMCRKDRPRKNQENKT